MWILLAEVAVNLCRGGCGPGGCLSRAPAFLKKVRLHVPMSGEREGCYWAALFPRCLLTLLAPVGLGNPQAARSHGHNAVLHVVA